MYQLNERSSVWPWRLFGLVALLAGAVTLLEGPGQEQTPPVPQPQTPAAEPAARQPAATDDIFQKNPFDVTLERPPPPAPPPPPPPPPPAVQKEPETKKDVKVPFKLYGTLVAGDFSVAFLSQEKSADQEPVTLGEKWKDLELLQVDRNEVLIRYRNETTSLKVDFNDWMKTAAVDGTALGSAAPPPPQPSQVPVYTQSGEVPMPDSIETRKVPRSEVNRHLQDLAGVLNQMRIQPYYKNGQPAGFLLTSIRPGSFVDLVGVRSGDILAFVNGQKINNVQNAFQLYNIFKNSTNVEVTVIRDTKPVTLKYVIE